MHRARRPVCPAGQLNRPRLHETTPQALVGEVAALVGKKYPTLTNSQIYARLKSTSREFCGPEHGGITGIINAEAALGGLCVPRGQFAEVTYSFLPGSPPQYTHNYMLPVQRRRRAGCVGSASESPSDASGMRFASGGARSEFPVRYMSVAASVYDRWSPNAAIAGTFEVKVVTQLACPPENPDCI